jgi:hypothetical protein
MAATFLVLFLLVLFLSYWKKRETMVVAWGIWGFLVGSASGDASNGWLTAVLVAVVRWGGGALVEEIGEKFLKNK